ncbi:hypothetical protein [Streptomyces phaeochromogenes]|uniref:hypothetical protein n=1 Tax=Streptomyces phaeochromogenes TaxID=1923 RepID=UPI0027D88059|nr:hypothetical protein [Streptomyces phaeochromogenes]
MFGAGVAHATPGGACQSATVQYRLVGADGGVVGADWTSQGGFRSWDTVPGPVEVRLAPGQKVADGCKYPVSLAEYTTEGPNWATSGRQTMVDKATVYLTAADVAGSDEEKRTWQKLAVKLPDCFGQIDLYGDDIAYDGKTGEGHGPAPYQPDGVTTPYHLIAAWNGGDKACANGPSDSPTPTPTPSEPTPSTPAGSTPPAEETTPPTTPQALRDASHDTGRAAAVVEAAHHPEPVAQRQLAAAGGDGCRRAGRPDRRWRRCGDRPGRRCGVRGSPLASLMTDAHGIVLVP